MKIRDLKIAWRILLKQPAHSLIVFLGLSVSFCVCFLLLGYARFSFEYDAHVPDAKRIFLVKHRLNVIAYPAWIDFNVWPLKETLGNSGIPHTLAFVDIDSLSVSTDSGLTNKMLVAAADRNFSRMIAVKVLQGDIATTLAKPDSVALTEKTAKSLFGLKPALGNRVDIEGKPYYVGALIQDLPNNATLTFAVLKGGAVEDYSRAYVQLPANVDVQTVQDRIQDVAERSPFSKGLLKHVTTPIGNIIPKRVIEIRLTSLADAYFDHDLKGRKNLVRGDERTVFALVGAAFLLVFLAATSFINLSVARTLRRQKEVGIYKILGASRLRIVTQFATESLCLSLAATSLGLFLAWLILPLFSDLMNRQLDDLFSFSNIAFSLLFSVLIGCVMSIYPTWLALCVNPQQALVGRGNGETSGGTRLRRGLMILQFSCAMGFGAISLAIAWQTYYSTKTNLGFEPDNLLVVTLAQSIEDSEGSTFRDALVRLPQIKDVAVSYWPVGKDVTGVDFVPLRASNGNYVMPNLEGVSLNFFAVHGVKALAGRVFDPTLDVPKYADKIVLNHAAITALGFTTPQSAIGQFVMDNRSEPRSVQIIGVVPNMRYRSAHDPEVPRIFIPAFWPHTFTILTDGNLPEATMQITKLWQQHFPNQIADIKTSTSLIAQNYEEDLRMSKLLIIAALLSLAIAAFGIYVLSAYSVQRRVQEIAIRKIYGAKTKSIALLLGKEFGFIMLASALIGLPLGGLAISHYLANFVERAPIGGWTLLFALSVALLIALVSSLRHALLAMRISPVVALRD